MLVPIMATKRGLKWRIILVYKAHTGAISNHGALSWFARQADVRPYSVTRWIKGTRPFRGPARALLENLEAQASALSAVNGAR